MHDKYMSAIFFAGEDQRRLAVERIEQAAKQLSFAGEQTLPESPEGCRLATSFGAERRSFVRQPASGVLWLRGTFILPVPGLIEEIE